MEATQRTTIDRAEVERFSAMAAEWWNPSGKFRPLHKFNPVRLEYIKRQVCANFGREHRAVSAVVSCLYAGLLLCQLFT